MAGIKNFTNSTDKKLAITIYIRDGENPGNTAGTQQFSLDRFETKQITYGNARNIYLNGMNVVSMYDGQVTGEQKFIIQRGSPLDDLFNRNNHIWIKFIETLFDISSSND